MIILTMCEKNFKKFWCYAFFLLITSLSKSEQSFTSNEEKNDNITIRYELDSTTNYGDKIKTLSYDLYEKSINNTQYDNMQNKFHTISMSNDDNTIRYKLSTSSTQNHMSDKQIPMGSQTNSTNANYKRNFTSQEIYGNLMNIEDNNNSTSHEFFENSNKESNISNIVSYETCQLDNITCIQLCCSPGDRLDDDICIPEKIKYFLPNVYKYTNDSLQSENKTVDELFQLTIYDPCQENRILLPYGFQYDYMFFANGSLYISYYKIFAKPTSYCLAITEGDKFEVTICSETYHEILKIADDQKADVDNKNLSVQNIKIIHMSFHIVSILFLISIFLVYSILPDLRNVHAFMLRSYSGILSVAYTIDIANIFIKSDAVEYSICVTIASFQYFCFLTSFFWLNIMSFDMWWTFRGFSSLQRNVRNREKKKLILYAICAWGIPFILAIICIIMDFASENLPKILQPGFHAGDCWFAEKGTFLLYYYGIKSICIISSICLSISTAVKIARYEKETGLRLTDSESKQYNDNKKWFNLYLKLFIMLFIVIGIKWSLMTATWLSENISNTTSYAIVNLIDIVQNFCTFIIFVCKKKIKQMLLKRFGCSGFITKARSPTNTISSGYQENTANYRFFNPSTKRITVIRDVTFNEKSTYTTSSIEESKEFESMIPKDKGSDEKIIWGRISGSH
ncbi:G-protein coupled receptor Mth2-like isoform X2 [Camponotus floridanus]|uniref:G-protein coupled receptor Mth2-like isoform X2 n=1 Tax=Camponotus floridanus TaxID=104421 RepID=UPI000DC679DE|nr:G-protein coupled receptor Mth2-like isoform X2 [Camponotus floridanus]